MKLNGNFAQKTNASDQTSKLKKSLIYTQYKNALSYELRNNVIQGCNNCCENSKCATGPTGPTGPIGATGATGPVGTLSEVLTNNNVANRDIDMDNNSLLNINSLSISTPPILTTLLTSTDYSVPIIINGNTYYLPLFTV